MFRVLLIRNDADMVATIKLSGVPRLRHRFVRHHTRCTSGISHGLMRHRFVRHHTRCNSGVSHGLMREGHVVVAVLTVVKYNK